MNLLAWIVIGLIAGVIAKAIMPGSKDEPGGLIGTILLGIVGAVVGGFVSGFFSGSRGIGGVNVGSIVTAILGACLFIGVLRLFRR